MENRKMMVAKSNPILNMKNDFDLYQQRMMNLYLAKINPLDESSRCVSVSLAQFVELIGIKKVSVKKLQALANKALDLRVDLCRVGIDDDGKKREMVQMDIISVWERFRVYSKDGVWTIDLLASGSIMPYLFQVKDLGYLNFSVLLALRMRSPIAEKLYEQCARFKDRGVFTITLDHLRERLGISGKKSYESYNRLKTGVLLRCMKEINEHTDIYVSIASEKRERRRGAPVSSITFSVKKNKNYQEDDADVKLRNLYGEEEKNIVEMKPFEVKANQPVSASVENEQNPQDTKQKQLQDRLQKEYGLSDDEIKYILQDQKKLTLPDERVEEVVAYAFAHVPETPIAYIRSMLRQKKAVLRMVSEEEKAKPVYRNQFNQIENNTYNFDELERELLGENAPEGLPPYYIIMDRPSEDVMKRLAAYTALGVPSDKIKVLTEEEYNKLK